MSKWNQGGESAARVLDFEVIDNSAAKSYDANLLEVDVMVIANPIEMLRQQGLDIDGIVKMVNENVKGSNIDIEALTEFPIGKLGNVSARMGRDDSVWVSVQSTYVGSDKLAQQGIDNKGKAMYLDTFRPLSVSGQTVDVSWRTVNRLQSVVREIVYAAGLADNPFDGAE